MAETRKTVLFIVEGPSDKEALTVPTVKDSGTERLITVGSPIVAFLTEPVKSRPLRGGWFLPRDPDLGTGMNC